MAKTHSPILSFIPLPSGASGYKWMQSDIASNLAPGIVAVAKWADLIIISNFHFPPLYKASISGGIKHRDGLIVFMLDIQGMYMDIIRNEKLWKVFCVHNILIAIALSTILLPVYLSLPTTSLPLFIVGISIMLFLWLIWSVLVFWQCALSCSWLYWGYFSRENFVLVTISSAASTLNLLLG